VQGSPWKIASEEGLYLEVMILPQMGRIRDLLRECSKYPAVTFVAVPYYNDRSQTIPKDGHNLVLLQPLCRGVPFNHFAEEFPMSRMTGLMR
jgi:hypothetical protein